MISFCTLLCHARDTPFILYTPFQLTYLNNNSFLSFVLSDSFKGGRAINYATDNFYVSRQLERRAAFDAYERSPIMLSEVYLRCSVLRLIKTIDAIAAAAFDGFSPGCSTVQIVAQQFAQFHLVLSPLLDLFLWAY